LTLSLLDQRDAGQLGLSPWLTPDHDVELVGSSLHLDSEVEASDDLSAVRQHLNLRGTLGCLMRQDLCLERVDELAGQEYVTSWLTAMTCSSAGFSAPYPPTIPNTPWQLYLGTVVARLH